MAKKSSFILLLLFLCYAGVCAYHTPSPEPIQLYASNFKHLFCKSIKQAQKSIDLMTYGLNDPDLVALLDHKRKAGIPILAICDKRASPKHPGITRVKKSGLNHAKIAIIDDQLSYLGSANFTTSSLEIHHNCVLGIRSVEVAQFLKTSITENTSGQFVWKNLHLFMLPEKNALSFLLELIEQAKHTIKIAMFTLSHPKLIEALESAQTRGVKTELYIDRHTKQPRISITIHHANSPGLMHHKWALIDDEHLVIGSANWTKAAFSKNREVLAIIYHLAPSQLAICKRLWSQLI